MDISSECDWFLPLLVESFYSYFLENKLEWNNYLISQSKMKTIFNKMKFGIIFKRCIGHAQGKARNMYKEQRILKALFCTWSMDFFLYHFRVHFVKPVFMVWRDPGVERKSPWDEILTKIINQIVEILQHLTYILRLICGDKLFLTPTVS